MGLDTDNVCDKVFNGIEALEKIRMDIVENSERGFGPQTSYKLILMDCNMPFMDGFEATEKIRKLIIECGIEEQPMILACTGHSDPEYVQKSI